MKKIGIIVEYNPLHNGHIYHLNTIRKLAKPDIIIAVCSSTFTMRGDLSVFDKFTKTKQALEAGVDLVLELPAVCAVQNADIFAYNACKTLMLAGVDEIWIGSEQNNVNIYQKYLEVENDNYFKNTLKSNLKKGLSYKNSYNMTLSSYNLPILEANDTLGLAYYRAIKELNANISLHTIQRIGDLENSDDIYSNYPSASQIRKNFNKDYVPDYVYNDYSSNYLDINDLYPLFQYKMITTDTTDIFFSTEGINNYLKKSINQNCYDDFINSSTNKRYSKSRIKRFFFYTLFGITKSKYETIKDQYNFIRALGANDLGISHLNSLKKDVLIYTNIKDLLNPILDIELTITKLLDTVYNTNLFKSEQGFIKKST